MFGEILNNLFAKYYSETLHSNMYDLPEEEQRVIACVLGTFVGFLKDVPEARQIYGVELINGQMPLSFNASIRVMQKEERRKNGLEHLSHVQRPTSIENKLFVWLFTVFPTEDIHREYRIGRYRVDFAIPELKLCFEADGEYWHNLELDAKRDTWLNSQGWIIERFSSLEINKW